MQWKHIKLQKHAGANWIKYVTKFLSNNLNICEIKKDIKTSFEKTL